MCFTLYALPSIASAVVIASLLIYVIAFRKNAPGAALFIALMICFTAWSSGYAMVLMNQEIGSKVFWFNLAQIGPDFSPIFWLLLTLEHSGRKNFLHSRWILLLFVLPLFTQFLMWTNDWHHLLRGSVSLRPIGDNTTYLSIESGPWYLIEIIYGYIMLSVSLFVLFQFYPLSSVKKQTLTLIYSMVLPILSNLLAIFNINPLTPFGPTSIIFSVTGLILSWGLFRHRLLDITPIARNVVLENIGDGVIVLDTQNRIVDVNPAAYPLFSEKISDPSQLVGKDIFRAISICPEWDEPFDMSNNRTHVALMVNEECHHFHVTISSLADNHHQEPVGWVTIFNDITDEKRANERLASKLDEIKHLQKKLEEQATRDPLTGCFNRHYLNEMLLRESSRANREKNTIGMIMLDIDHFKQINDTYGHICGDHVLQDIGENLQQWIRLEDMVCRYGGEEFLIIFPGISLQAITERANMLCKQIAALQIPASSDVIIQVTVSMGAAVYPLQGEDINQVLEYADQALYTAKNAGKNRIFVWGSAVGDR